MNPPLTHIPAYDCNLPSTAKPRWPRADALAVARELCQALTPHVERIIVAGSLRRRKETVGDVEIIYIPKLQHAPQLAQADLLPGSATVPVAFTNLTDQALARLAETATILPRKNVTGSVTWGPKNKLARHTASGIPVDLFSATAENWWNYLICRTGSAEHNVKIASAAQAKGWKWHPYNTGFTDDQGKSVTVTSEQHLFELLEMPYLQPWERI